MAIRFAIDGDLRFISHHDTMRLFERAISRAQLPVKFSEGFNPRPRLSLPIPRAVGVASDADVLVIELTESAEPSAMRDELASQMPQGISLLDAWSVPGGATLQPETAAYRLPVSPAQAGELAGAVDRLLGADRWSVPRSGADRRGTRSIDVRAFVRDARVDSEHLHWTVRVGNDGTARPAEVLAALGLSPEEFHHKVRRTSIQWAGGPPLPDAEPALADS